MFEASLIVSHNGPSPPKAGSKYVFEKRSVLASLWAWHTICSLFCLKIRMIYAVECCKEPFRRRTCFSWESELLGILPRTSPLRSQERPWWLKVCGIHRKQLLSKIGKMKKNPPRVSLQLQNLVFLCTDRTVRRNCALYTWNSFHSPKWHDGGANSPICPSWSEGALGNRWRYRDFNQALNWSVIFIRYCILYKLIFSNKMPVTFAKCPSRLPGSRALLRDNLRRNLCRLRKGRKEKLPKFNLSSIGSHAESWEIWLTYFSLLDFYHQTPNTAKYTIYGDFSVDRVTYFTRASLTLTLTGCAAIRRVNTIYGEHLCRLFISFIPLHPLPSCK